MRFSSIGDEISDVIGSARAADGVTRMTSNRVEALARTPSLGLLRWLRKIAPSLQSTRQFSISRKTTKPLGLLGEDSKEAASRNRGLPASSSRPEAKGTPRASALPMRAAASSQTTYWRTPTLIVGAFPLVTLASTNTLPSALIAPLLKLPSASVSVNVPSGATV
jgi:hypothetical protein